MKPSSKSTTGPWQYVFEGGTVAFILETDGTTVAKISVTENSTAHSALAANVRLMTNAPALLEALEDMLSGWKYIRETHGDLYGVGWDRAQEKAEAAIAKATGETK